VREARRAPGSGAQPKRPNARARGGRKEKEGREEERKEKRKGRKWEKGNGEKKGK
jgi:hypothetical protein